MEAHVRRLMAQPHFDRARLWHSARCDLSGGRRDQQTVHKYIGGKSTQGVATYSGPCAPPGSPHHYTFVIIATDLDARELPPGLTMPELWARLAGHTKGAAGMVGMFINPYPQRCGGIYRD